MSDRSGTGQVWITRFLNGVVTSVFVVLAPSQRDPSRRFLSHDTLVLFEAFDPPHVGMVLPRYEHFRSHDDDDDDDELFDWEGNPHMTRIA